VIKLRRLRWGRGHMGCTEEYRTAQVLVGKPERTNHLEGPDVDGRILKGISRI
jgi:hypothetical protein